MKTDCEPTGRTDCLLRDNTEEVTQGGTVILTEGWNARSSGAGKAVKNNPNILPGGAWPSSV